MAPLDPEKKAALMMKLKAGREKTAAMRAEAKAKGLPDPKPRKARKSKKGAVVKDGLADKPDNQTIPGIDAPTPASKNVVAEAPVDPAPNATSKIDVPNLPDEAGRKKIIKKAEKEPVLEGKKGLSTTGRTKKINDNVLITNEETGMQALETMLPGQKESIKKLLRNDKKLKPEAPKPNPEPANAAGGNNKTVLNVDSHIPDMKSVEGRAPFSFATIRKQLYQ
jgi:uncharacterized protein YkvS